MSKFFLRFFYLVIIIFLISVFYLSYFGVKTDKFDALIKNKVNEVNQHVKLEFKATKIHLNIRKLNLTVKLQNPNILISDNQIKLSKLDLFLSVKSFFSSDFLLQKAEIAFTKNDIKDLTKITNIFLPNIINNQLNNIFEKGYLDGEFVIPFKKDGSIGKDYAFSGKISEASINLTKDFQIKNLTTKIKHKTINEIEAEIIKGQFLNLELSGSKVEFKNENNAKKIKTELHTSGEVNFSQIKNILTLFNLENNYFTNINLIADLKTNIDFEINNKFKIKNLKYSIKGVINQLKLNNKENKVIKKYLPEFNSKIILKETNVNFINSKSLYSIELNGLVKIKDKFDKFNIKEIYNSQNKSYNITGMIDLTNLKVEIPNLNYIKDNKEKSELIFDTNFVTNKQYNIKELIFSANKTKINLRGIKLNKNFETTDFENLEIKTFSNKIKNNDFLIKKSKKIVISGEVFDAQPLLKSLYKKSDKKTFSKNFNSEVAINFNKMLTGTDDLVSNFTMIASINKGSYTKISSKGNFSANEIIEMSIYQIDKDKKTLQVISDRARPFIKNFDFIKGFEDGKLEYESVISKKGSSSNLIITDFKVSKVPALAKLLTLASLQGIADTLSGEGIRFESFEMKTNSEGNVLNIEDALAFGPAVSILLEGYVDKGKVVSLRGTLVPATKLNSIIASIPVVGDILVGKKAGEGVVGVSFKMKGPPKEIKTTVNPIKTLTPRFIVRALEKMKKKNKETSK